MSRVGVLFRYMNDTDGNSEYYYTWRGRHRGVVYMAYLSFVFTAIAIFSALVIYERSLSEIGLKGILYPLIVCVLVGMLADYISATGVIKRYHMVGLGEDGLTTQVTREERVFVPWISIVKIDDFNILDMQITDPVHKSPDFWVARGVGGVRVTTNDNKIYRIFRTLKDYRTVRAEVIRRAPNAILLKNGKPTKRPG